MKIVIVLESNINNIEYDQDDIILTNNLSFVNGLKTHIELSKVYDVWDDIIPENITNDLFTQLPLSFSSLKNSLYWVFSIPLYSIVNKIDSLMSQNPIDEICLYGGNEYIYFAMKSAEGEGEHWQYETSWFLNPIIYQLYKNKVKVVWYNKIKYIKFKHQYRESLLYCKLVFKSIVLDVLKLIYSTKKKSNNYDVAIISYLPLQYKKLHNIVENAGYKNIIDITSYHSILSQENKKILTYYPYSLKNVIKFSILYSCVYKKISKNIILRINDNEICIPKKNVRQTLCTKFVEYYSELNSLQRLFISLPRINVITGFTFGSDLVLINELCQNCHLKHYNFQIVSFAKMRYPNVNLADKYFLLNTEITKYYQERSSCYFQYVPPYVFRECNYSDIRIGIFLQPDSFVDNYLLLCESIISRLNSKIKIIIKPHYRQNRLSEFELMIRGRQNISILDKNMAIEESLRLVDVAISISSSIFFDAILQDVMGVSILNNENDRKVVEQSNIALKEVNFIVYSVDEIIQIIDNFDVYRNKYQNRRQTWLDKNSQYLISNLKL